MTIELFAIVKDTIFESKSQHIEINTVFGLMWFGADALKWEDELFFYRTGIALKLWEKGVGKSL